MLAGLVQAPSRLAPTKNLKGARARAKLVLAAMVEAGFISQEDVDAARPARLRVHKEKSELPSGTYFADWALPQIRANLDVRYGEQKVMTTLDAKLQRIAREVVASAPLGEAQIALVAMKTNGEVVAMIGGKNYRKSPFNRATQARRQPGSTFKLFVYLAAMRAGMTPDTLIDDTPITQGAYRPRNAGDSYRGKITLKQAFARSSNVAAYRLYRQLGDKAVIQAARDLGIASPLAADPSLALGTSSVTLLELTAAYAAIAANEYPVESHAIPAEQPSLFDRLIHGKRSLGAKTQQQMLDLLRATVIQGTGRSAGLSIPAYGKTGTSQDSRDALFIGFAGDLVVGVWVGRDDNKPLGGIHGGGLPARIWRDFMGRAIANSIPEKAPEDEQVADNTMENVTADLVPEIQFESPDADVPVDADPALPAQGSASSADPVPAAPAPVPAPSGGAPPPPRQ